MNPLTHTYKTKLKILILTASYCMLSACAQNPVTGKNELMFIPESQELSIGENNYSYMQQSQGGIYKGSPAMTQLVQEVGQKLARVSDRSDLPYEFVVVNDATPNAWAMPGGKIAIHRGLLTELSSEAELAAVLSHEITHAAAKHSAKSMQRQILLSAGLTGANLALQDEENQTRNNTILLASGLAGHLALQKYSRNQELEADHYGMIYMTRAGYEPQAAVSLQQTFVKLGKKPNWLEGLFASHPPSQERVQANTQMAQQLNVRGHLGQESYQKALAPMISQKPAYDAFEKAKSAWTENKTKEALALIDTAIQTYPQEALFYSLKGDIFETSNQAKQAVEQYHKAIQLNPDYYYPYLKRGLIYKSLGHIADAQLDLENAQRLMPTQNAKQALDSLSGVA